MPTTHTSRVDFNGDGTTDLLWQSATDGSLVIWNMDTTGHMIIGARQLPSPGPDWSIKTLPDIFGDGVTDIVWQTQAGVMTAWEIGKDGSILGQQLHFGFNATQVVASGDFNGSGQNQALHYTPPNNGAGGGWGSATLDDRKIPPFGVGTLEQISLDWQFQGVGDFNGDGKDDLLFRGSGSTAGGFLIENLNTTPAKDFGLMPSTQAHFQDPGAFWSVVKIADFNGDGHADLLWQGQDGTPAIWLMNNEHVGQGAVLPNPGAGWSIVDAQDYNGDGRADILWRGVDGTIVEWFMNGLQGGEANVSIPNPGLGWHLLGA